MADVLDFLTRITGGDSSSDSSDGFDLEDFTRGFTGPASQSASDTSGAFDISNPSFYPRSESNPSGYDPSASYNQPLSSIDPKKAWEFIKGLPKEIGDFAKQNPDFMRLLLGGMGAYFGATQDVPKATGGGYAKRYVGPEQQLTRTLDRGPYGRIARHAATGGIMHAYANGGQVKPFPMQDGGFVMTKRAVDGAGGPQGIRSLIPEASMIRGPGHGTSDSIPAYIQGQNGRTPARVSNGEAYVPPGNDTRQLYALMRALERKA